MEMDPNFKGIYMSAALTGVVYTLKRPHHFSQSAPKIYFSHKQAFTKPKIFFFKVVFVQFKTLILVAFPPLAMVH